MAKENLAIYFNANMKRVGEDRNISLNEYISELKGNKLIKSFRKYHNVTLFCNSFNDFTKPLEIALTMKYLASGKCRWINSAKETKNISFIYIIFLLFSYIRDKLTYKSYINHIYKEVNDLFKISPSQKMRVDGYACYLKSDLTHGYLAGGSLGHVAGVLNNLESECMAPPIFITSDFIPNVNSNVEQVRIDGNVLYRGIADVSSLSYNEPVYRTIERAIGAEKPSFIYHRYAMNSYCGIKYALLHDIPLILEYNGSEVWIEEKWGNNKLKTIEVARKIELLNFEKAALITCVSTPLKEQLIELGIDNNKIIVVPNSVDTDIYRPDIDGSIIRNKYKIAENTVVVGFIGTFGAWHGAEVLADAIVELRNKGIDCIHVLFIGDGLKMPEVRRVISEGKCDAICTFTGIVPQEKGKDYLAACDILVSPTVKNPDGTPFFGSPTKLFEYMAMGKAIVVSNMDQMAEVCEDRKTALLSEPGNSHDVAARIEELVNDKSLRTELGMNARRVACEKYTWKKHTHTIIEKYKEKIHEL